MAGGTPLRLIVPALVVVIAHVAAFGRFPVGSVAGLLTAASGVAAVAMARAAFRGSAAGSRPRTLALAAGIALAALAAAGGAIASAVAPGVLVDGVPLPAEITLVALFLVALLFVPAILRPQQRRSGLARLRAGLDVLGVWACLMFSSWLLLFSNGGERRGAAITALIFGGAAATTVGVAGVHAVRHKAALQWCGPAAALLLVGMGALVIALDFPGKTNAAIAAVVAAVAIDVAAGLLWYASVRLSPDDSAMPPPGSEPAATLPLLTLPLLGSALITVYHLLNGGRVDATAIMLGSLGVAAVATREWVSAVALHRQAGHLADQGNRLRSLMYGASDVAVVLDENLAVRWQSPAAVRWFGPALGRSVSVLVDPEQVDEVHAYLVARMTDPTAVEESIVVRPRDRHDGRETEWTTSGADPAEPGHTLVVHLRDVTNVRTLERALRQATHLDAQTGLANREGLLRAAELMPDAAAMIVVELGGLTAVGDVHGRELAESVLVEAARRLRGRVAAADVAARVGETRFAVLTHRGAVRAHLLAGQLVNALSAPYTTADTVSHLSAWAGLADLTGDEPADEVLRRSQLALRSVRAEPPGAVEWYDAEMETRLMRRSTLEQDLPGADIDLLFQVIADPRDRRPAGVEVVPAWRHPTLGPVPVSELLDLADELGILAKIGHRVLQTSCRLLADWRRRHEGLWLAVGVRPRQLLDPAFQASLHTALEDHGLPHSALVVEISEDDVRSPGVGELAAHLGRLRAEGVRTAIDNFGTGPTSLSRLRILPADLLKIDREVFTEPAVMDVAVTLGRRLGMEVIAHGVGDASDLATAEAAGCHLVQGDLLGRPMPAERLEALLQEHWDAQPS
ncbi:EAL domain-containing protein [Paractinoplanes deccanensis]|uniref:EAL domain-containing protein n=1 Tax=Paractinoplanes deccanensis TaxID=113561 RepID=UPI00360BDA6C